jgi:hypothetical protein
MAKMKIKFLKSHFRFGYVAGEEAEIEQILVETLGLEKKGFVEVLKRPKKAEVIEDPGAEVKKLKNKKNGL